VDVPSSNIVLLKDHVELPVDDHIAVVRTSPTTLDIVINKAKLSDEGTYSMKIDDREQALMQLKVIPKPVTRQTMDLPQTTFNEGETLTIKCQFDSLPDEPFEFLRNGQPLTADDRIVTSVDGNTFVIVVKDLRPDEDEGVYTLQSPHLVLDTPPITVNPKDIESASRATETILEEETIVIVPAQQPDVIEVEIVENEGDTVSCTDELDKTRIPIQLLSIRA
jgi:hypothetical protein